VAQALPQAEQVQAQVLELALVQEQARVLVQAQGMG